MSKKLTKGKIKLVENKKFVPELADIKKDSPLGAKFDFTSTLKKELAPSTTIAIYFKLNTGDEEFHIVKTTGKKFELYKQTYLVDTKYLTYNRTFKMFMGTYHEDITLPIKQIINVEDMKAKLNKNKDFAEVVSNINPRILTEFSKSKVIQDTLNGHALSTVMGFLKVMGLITVVLCIVILLLNLQMSGLFANL